MKTIEQELKDYEEINRQHIQAGHKKITLRSNHLSDLLNIARNDENGLEWALITNAFKVGVSMGYRARKAEEKDRKGGKQ